MFPNQNFFSIRSKSHHQPKGKYVQTRVLVFPQNWKYLLCDEVQGKLLLDTGQPFLKQERHNLFYSLHSGHSFRLYRLLPHIFFSLLSNSNYMTIENLQDENEQAPIPQTIEDIEFDLVTEDDPEFETALSVINTNGEKSTDELVEDAKKEVVRTSWWLQ